MWLSKLKAFFSPYLSQVNSGRIKFFNRRKGYGFIQSENLDQDIFVHVSDLEDIVAKGDRVIFEIESSPRGPEARNVRLA